MSGLGQNIHLLHCAAAGLRGRWGSAAWAGPEATRRLLGHSCQRGGGQPGEGGQGGEKRQVSIRETGDGAGGGHPC